MSQQLSRLLLIRIETNPGTYESLCGFKARSFNMSANEVDTTIPDCDNPGGPVQKTSIPGVASRTFTGSGKFVSGVKQAILMGHVRATEVFNAEVIVPGDGVYRGAWMVSDFEVSGDGEEGTMEFSATFSAAGALTFTAEAGAPVNSLLPSIAGIAKVGETLTAMEGSWSHGATFSYQWKVDGTNKSGATAKTYSPVVGDVGKAVSVAITASNTSGSASATSGETADVVAA
ncbi:phage tail tube protein [Aquamicrobium defluvii]|nr:phage tail tube protein [Aquamicrobium defluvii]